MISYLQQNLFFTALLFLLSLNWNCSSSKSITANKTENTKNPIMEATNYWNQRSNAEAIDKAETYINKAIEQNPNDFESSILLGKIKFTQAYFLEENQSARELLFYEGKEICKKGVLNHPDFIQVYNNTNGDSSIKLLSSLANSPESVLAGLYWWGQNLAHYLNNQSVINRINHRELIEVIMHRVLALDPGFDYSGPYRFFGMFYTKIPGLEISQSLSYFNQALKTNPDFLGNTVFMAEFLYQKSGNREKFNQLLNDVLNINLTKHPDIMTDNLFYQKRAQFLLENESSLFE